MLVAKKTIKGKPETKENLSPFKGEYFYANGKRKTSVAQVRLYKGKGQVVINGQPIDEYVSVTEFINLLLDPLELTGNTSKFDISIITSGGGVKGQAEAMRHGISRALVVFDAELRATLKKAGYLTRDSRIKERKKPGLKRARRAPQWNKR